MGTFPQCFTVGQAATMIPPMNDDRRRDGARAAPWHNAAMTLQKRQPRAELTPAGRLEEARLQRVLGYQLAQAAIVTDGIFRDTVGTPMDLRPVEYTVLTLIEENPGGSMGQLARALSVTPPNITALVDRLQARGLVERTASTKDRRAQVLKATAAGAELVRLATDSILSAEQARLPLTRGEQAILSELLHKVACARQASAATATEAAVQRQA
jgi:DNA-binding MarR family transcriptional regulator